MRMEIEAQYDVRNRRPSPPSPHWGLLGAYAAFRDPAAARRQAVLGFDLEAIRLRPSGLGGAVGIESHHGPLQSSALEPETDVVKVHGGIQLGKFSKQPKHRDGLCPSPAANQISAIVAAKSFVVVYVAAHNDDPGVERARMLGQVARNLLLVLSPRKDRVPNGWVMQHDEDEFHSGTRIGNLLFKPTPLFASGLEG